MAKRDFIFIDESGEPGKVTPYYIVSLIHLTDETLKAINIHLGAFRYFGQIKKELKSTRLTKLQKEQILNILRLSLSNNFFIKTSSVYVNKIKYKGPYLNDKPNFFRNLILRKLLEFHFELFIPQTNEIELIIDRFYSSEKLENSLRKYLRKDEQKKLPEFLHIIQADSRYVELLQIADWISGVVKESIFTHPERTHLKEILKLINLKEILK